MIVIGRVGIARHYLIHTVTEVNIVYMMLIFPDGCFWQAMPALPGCEMN